METAWLSTRLRAARPRVIAALNRYFGDVDLAEDAFQEAAFRASRTWSPGNLPRDTVAWLIIAGRNHGIDLIRKTRRESPQELSQLENYADPDTHEEDMVEAADHRAFRDDFLRLLFTCCHPILRRDQQIALSLKVVAGLSVEEIARAFLIKPKTMEQRITRAKKRISTASIPYSTPGAQERTERLNAVATSIYLLFNEGYSTTDGNAWIKTSLCEEAVRLARLLSRVFPEEPEIRGLLALCLLHHSRRKARVDISGRAITLDNQDRHLWDRTMIAEGRVLIEAALRRGRPGPLQIEAAIAATHALAPNEAATNWAEIERLYRALEIVRPTPVVTLNRAAALAHVAGPQWALDLIDPLSTALASYAPFHAMRGALLAELGNSTAARQALESAIDLTGSETERFHIQNRISEL